MPVSLADDAALRAASSGGASAFHGGAGRDDFDGEGEFEDESPSQQSEHKAEAARREANWLRKSLQVWLKKFPLTIRQRRHTDDATLLYALIAPGTVATNAAGAVEGLSVAPLGGGARRATLQEVLETFVELEAETLLCLPTTNGMNDTLMSLCLRTVSEKESARIVLRKVARALEPAQHRNFTPAQHRVIMRDLILAFKYGFAIEVYQAIEKAKGRDELLNEKAQLTFKSDESGYEVSRPRISIIPLLD